VVGGVVGAVGGALTARGGRRDNAAAAEQLLLQHKDQVPLAPGDSTPKGP
jgi:hypothetical protein